MSHFKARPDYKELFARLVQQAGGKCALCPRTKPLDIDYDQFNNPRSVLCVECLYLVRHYEASQAKAPQITAYLNKFKKT